LFECRYVYSDSNILYPSFTKRVSGKPKPGLGLTSIRERVILYAALFMARIWLGEI
jgi:hypothetical protein